MCLPVAVAYGLAGVSSRVGSWALLAATVWAFGCVVVFAGRPGRRFWALCILALVAAAGFGRVQVGDNVRDVGQFVHNATHHIPHP